MSYFYNSNDSNSRSKFIKRNRPEGSIIKAIELQQGEIYFRVSELSKNYTTRSSVIPFRIISDVYSEIIGGIAIPFVKCTKNNGETYTSLSLRDMNVEKENTYNNHYLFKEESYALKYAKEIENQN